MSSKEEYTLTTEQDYKLFVNEILYWINKFGLLDWEIFFEWKEVNGVIARMEYNIISRGASALLSKKIPKREYDKFNIIKTAFHEVCELLLCDINEFMAVDVGEYIPKYLRDRDESEIHKVIRIMENVVFIDDVKLRFGIDKSAGIVEVVNFVNSKLEEK